jgi:hypothetical protein
MQSILPSHRPMLPPETRFQHRRNLETRFGGDKRPIFLDGIIRGTPVTAQVGETLYYLSAGFLTFNQIDFTSCLSADG